MTFDYDDHGMITLIHATIGELPEGGHAIFRNTQISAAQLRWHGQTYLAPLGTLPPADEDNEPSNDWVRVIPD